MPTASRSWSTRSRYRGPEGSHCRQFDPIVDLLMDDVYDDIDVAREIFQTWKAQESAQVQS